MEAQSLDENLQVSQGKTRMQRKSYVNREGKFFGDPKLQGRGTPVPNMPETKVEAVE